MLKKAAPGVRYDAGMELPPRSASPKDALQGSTDVELVAELVRDGLRMDVRERRTAEGIEYSFHHGHEVGNVTATERRSFSDETEAQAYIRAELTRLVSEGWQRARPELGS